MAEETRDKGITAYDVIKEKADAAGLTVDEYINSVMTAEKDAKQGEQA